jgi:hypothetical protein
MLSPSDYRSTSLDEAERKARAYRRSIEAGRPIDQLRQQAIDRLKAAGLTPRDIRWELILTGRRLS